MDNIILKHNNQILFKDNNVYYVNNGKKTDELYLWGKNKGWRVICGYFMINKTLVSKINEINESL